MEDGEIEISDHILHSSLSSDSFLDDLLRNSHTCTHTHTCNPPGPDAAHTHTCYHTHTHVIPSDEDATLRDPKSPVSKPRRPLGNREAVRKYREKKKAHAAYLEEEVKKLRLMNQVLMGKLRRQTILETEVLRLRGLLVDLGGKIDHELGDYTSFPEGGPSNGVSRCGNTATARGSLCQAPPIRCDANTNYLESGKKCLQE